MRKAAHDWEPGVWLDQLREKLAIAGQGYFRSEVDGIEAASGSNTWPPIRYNRTSYALLSLGIVSDALAEIPELREHRGLVPLHDLMAALIDLGQGGRPALLQPTAGVGRGSELTADRWVRQHALLFVAVLEAAGMKGVKACEVVANLLAASGHVGRKRDSGTGLPNPLSPKTVAHWRSEMRRRDFEERDPRLARFLTRNLRAIKDRPDWPMAQDAAVLWVETMAASDLLASKKV